MQDTQHKLLFHILDSERSILSRTDQKALTLLSVLGVFMVFFIVYYRLLVTNAFLVAMLGVYFVSAFCTIFYLLRTITPRFRHQAPDVDGTDQTDPTFFGGIKEFQSGEEYYEYMREMGSSDAHAAQLISRQIHALALINWTKNLSLRRAMYLFVIAIGSELLMILSVFIAMALEK